VAQWTTEQLVDELFARSFAAVFAWRDPDGQVQLRPLEGTGSSIGLGLACRLENECARATLDPSRQPDIPKLLEGYGPLEACSLDLVTMDGLLAELIRITPGDWVLGMVRLRKDSRSHWSGLFWNGAAPICTGLAAVLASFIELKIRARRVAGDPTFGEQIVKPLNALRRNICQPGRTWAIGYLRVCEGLCEEEEGRAMPDGDLATFVRMD
jgi:hypothetical protein